MHPLEHQHQAEGAIFRCVESILPLDFNVQTYMQALDELMSAESQTHDIIESSVRGMQRAIGIIRDIIRGNVIPDIEYE